MLHYIQSIKKTETVALNENPPHLNVKKKKTIKSFDLLEYVCWLADAEKLYNLALLTYDLELVSSIA